METKEIIRSNKWRNEIKVKHLFTDGDDVTPELVTQLCEHIATQLKAIQTKEASGNLIDDSKNHVDGELNELIGHFEFLKDLATGEIPEKEWNNYSFDGDFEQWFNDYLQQLYDLGDTRVLTTGNVLEKFIWID
jgi:hypothetical protein